MMASSRPAVRADLVFRPLAHEWVVLDPRGKRLHVLNLTAALVWGHLDGQRSTEQLVDLVLGAFEEAPEREDVAREVTGVLHDFASRGLLEPGVTIQ